LFRDLGCRDEAAYQPLSRSIHSGAESPDLLPKAVAGTFPGVEYFDVSVTNGCIVLASVELQRAAGQARRLSMGPSLTKSILQPKMYLRVDT
jgi:hypothetical protein